MRIAKVKGIAAIAAIAFAFAAAAWAATPSPYAGQQNREIRSLSESEVADLLAGKGMGYANAAELNGYPGPAHVLELRSELGLSAEQLAQTQAIFQRMESSAKSLGAELVQAERALEASFRNREVSPDSLARALERIAAIEGKLRNVHLGAHLEQTRVLSPAQAARYARLRGYAGDAGDAGGHHGHHPGHK